MNPHFSLAHQANVITIMSKSSEFISNTSFVPPQVRPRASRVFALAGAVSVIVLTFFFPGFQNTFFNLKWRAVEEAPFSWDDVCLTLLLAKDSTQLFSLLHPRLSSSTHASMVTNAPSSQYRSTGQRPRNRMPNELRLPSLACLLKSR
jgi:hypothetical protein